MPGHYFAVHRNRTEFLYITQSQLFKRPVNTTTSRGFYFTKNISCMPCVPMLHFVFRTEIPSLLISANLDFILHPYSSAKAEITTVHK